MKLRLTKTAQALVPAVGLTFALSAFAADEAGQPGAQRTQDVLEQGTTLHAGPSTIRQVQETLKERGYEVGPVDGKWGPQTQSALREFQQAQGMEPTGRLSLQTLTALGIDTDPGATAGQAAATDADRAAPAATTAQRDAAQQATLPGGNLRASELIGMEVRNAQGEDLGKIDDLVIDANNERVHYAVLSFGGFMGLGDKKFAYPMRTLNPARDGEHLVLNVPKERLKAAPGFERDASPTWGADDPYRANVDRYFGDVVQVEPRPNMLLRSASDLLDANVRDASGEEVGEIEDIVVDPRNGEVQFAVVAFEQGWFQPDRYATLPMRALSVMRDGDDLVVSLDREQIATAPGFNRNQWPDMQDRGYRTGVERWYTNFEEDVARANRPADESRTGTQ